MPQNDSRGTFQSTKHGFFVQILEAKNTLFIWLLDLKVVPLWKLEEC